jgi:acetyltransferase-like isoleucine patch superfamily enzyme
VRAAAALAGSTVEVDIAPDVEIAWNARPEVWPRTSSRLTIGEGAKIGEGVVLSLRGGSISIGRRALVRRAVHMNATGELRIGDDTVVSWGVIVHCAQGVALGDLSMLAEYVTVADSNHVRTPPGEPVHHRVRTAPVSIGENVWVGAKATITAGVTVGDQAFVGANSVVVDDVPAGWLAAGVPATNRRELPVG